MNNQIPSYKLLPILHISNCHRDQTSPIGDLSGSDNQIRETLIRLSFAGRDAFSASRDRIVRAIQRPKGKYTLRKRILWKHEEKIAWSIAGITKENLSQTHLWDVMKRGTRNRVNHANHGSSASAISVVLSRKAEEILTSRHCWANISRVKVRDWHLRIRGVNQWHFRARTFF